MLFTLLDYSLELGFSQRLQRKQYECVNTFCRRYALEKYKSTGLLLIATLC